MARPVEVEVSVNIDRTVEELKDIIGDVVELSDLVPEWNNMEADQIEQRIYRRLSGLIDSEVKKW